MEDSSGPAATSGSSPSGAPTTNSASGPRKVPIHLQSSQNRLLIKNGRIVNDDSLLDADIYIENGIIAQIGQNLIIPGGVRVIDARANSPNEVNYILPGGIDTHTHLDDIFMGAHTADDFYSGSRAALAGGTTSFINFAIATKQAPSLLEAYEKMRKTADEQVCCDYALHVGIGEWIDGKTDREMATLVRDHGVNSFKIFLCYPEVQLNDKQIIKVLTTSAKLGALVVVHCENGDIIEYNAQKLISQGITGPEGHLYSRPECIEAEATKRVSTIAGQVHCPVLVAHVMSKSAVKIIAEERLSNSCLFGETIIAALATNGNHIFNKCWRHAAHHVMSPPLRTDTTTGSDLTAALAAGTLHVLGSDHCCFNTEARKHGERDFRKLPNGLNGIEERMLLAWEKGVRGGFLDPCKFVAITSTNAAKLFNLYPRKGRIQVGSDADLVIWGRKEKIIRVSDQVSKGDFNIFEGMRVESGPLVVVSQGRVVLDNSGIRVTQGSGRYLIRQPFSTMAYGAIRIKSRLIPRAVDRSIESQVVQTTVTKSERELDQAQPNLDPTPVVAVKLDEKLGEINLSENQENQSSPDASSGFHSRASKSGVKNMQDSTFKLSGEQVDDKQNRLNIRVSGQPPGGRSSGLW